MVIYDVSVPVSSATPVYPGDPGIQIQSWAAISRGDAANVSLLQFGAHTGTHIDAPAHFIEDSTRLSEIPLETLIGAARVIEVPEDLSLITPELMHGENLGSASRVLFKTRNSNFWSAGKGFDRDYVCLSTEAAEFLAQSDVRLVGIDYLSIEAFRSEGHPTHLALLSRGVVILEGLDLTGIAPGDYELICLPLKIAEGAGDGAPVRAVLRTT